MASSDWLPLMPPDMRETWTAILARSIEIDERGCHNFTGARRRGYGTVKTGVGSTNAHRLAWFLFKGDIPAGTFICHRCDNPACINVEHLFIGSPADNNADCRAKGRRPKSYRKRMGRS